jgi:hypothetical protein
VGKVGITLVLVGMGWVPPEKEHADRARRPIIKTPIINFFTYFLQFLGLDAPSAFTLLYVAAYKVGFPPFTYSDYVAEDETVTLHPCGAPWVIELGASNWSSKTQFEFPVGVVWSVGADPEGTVTPKAPPPSLAFN